MSRLRLELAVLVTLLASLLTVPLPLPHVAIAMAWAVLTAVHLVRRRRIYAALLRSGRHRVRVAATTALIGSAVVATLSGFAQWAGVAAAAIPWHAGSSTLLVVLTVAHAASRLWPVRRRHVTLIVKHSGWNAEGVVARLVKADLVEPGRVDAGSRWTMRCADRTPHGSQPALGIVDDLLDLPGHALVSRRRVPTHRSHSLIRETPRAAGI
jgi:hypothetical protein